MTEFRYFSFNGQKFCTCDAITILDVMIYFGYNVSLLVLEYNNLICYKENWNRIFIKNNDTIEIVTIVGGG